MVQRDFSPRNTFVWAPLQEGTYYLQVTVKEAYTGTNVAATVAPYVVTPLATGSTPVITSTANPLVALYSAPACSAGQIVVKFRQQGTAAWTGTATQPCVSGLSRNFLVAGMLPQTTYEMVNVNVNGSSAVTSTSLLFTTGKIPSSLIFPAFGVVQPPGPTSDVAEGLLFHAPGFGANRSDASPIVTDLQGRVAWYSNQADLATVLAVRIEAVGGQLGDVVYVMGNDGQQKLDDNVLREIDLAGDPLQETNVEAVNAQLAAIGQDQIYGFNHDAIRLPNGDTAVLAFTEQTITTTPIMGDMLIVLGPDFQVVWTWNAFDYLDPNRGPTMGETCGSERSRCPVPYGPTTVDWTHTNAIAWSPLDGNLVLCIRNQDWIIKINYANGTGNGDILWRMGPQGDFTIVPLNASDPFPWFSHQHDANYVDGTTLEVFDDGNLRCATLPPPCNSRGQVYEVNEATKVVTQTVNVDLGNYSTALGAAQRLSNGNYNFTSGEIYVPPPPHGQDIEVQPDGTKVYVQQVNGLEYRGYRLASMYSPINPPCPTCPTAP